MRSALAAAVDGSLVGYFGSIGSSGDFWLMTGTAGLGGIRALTQYVVLLFVTATSMSTANIFTQILNIVISIPIQHTVVTAPLGAGIGLVVVFSALYTFLKNSKAALPWVDAHTEGCQRLGGCWRDGDGPAKA